MVVRVLLSNTDPSQDSGFQTTPPDLPSLSNSAPFSSQATPAGSLGALGAGRWLSPLGRQRREVRLRLPWSLANVDLKLLSGNLTELLKMTIYSGFTH